MLRIGDRTARPRPTRCASRQHSRRVGWVCSIADWRAIVEGAPSAMVTAVLSEVSFIDAEGERLLERMSGVA